MHGMSTFTQIWGYLRVMSTNQNIPNQLTHLDERPLSAIVGNKDQPLIKPNNIRRVTDLPRGWFNSHDPQAWRVYPLYSLLNPNFRKWFKWKKSPSTSATELFQRCSRPKTLILDSQPRRRLPKWQDTLQGTARYVACIQITIDIIHDYT